MKVAVLVSGRGSNLQALIDAVNSKELQVEICLVLSDKADAYALERAHRHGIPTAVVQRKGYSNKEEFQKAILEEVKSHGAELVVLAGFMRILGRTFLSSFPNRVINIHPALLPAFPGIDAQRQALDYGVKFSGCTVHFVDEGMDSGPIIAQHDVPVMDDDDRDALADRILEQEHLLIVEGVKLFSEGRLKVDGRKVTIV